MKLNNTTIRVQASKNYQVAEVTFEISDYTGEELERVKDTAIKHCVDMVSTLSDEIGAPHDAPVKTTVSAPKYTAPKANSTPRKVTEPTGDLPKKKTVNVNGYAVDYTLHFGKDGNPYYGIDNREFIDTIGAKKWIGVK